MKVLITIAVLLVLLADAHAFNVTIDFEELPIDGDLMSGPYTIETKGFNFSGTTWKGITEWPLGAIDDSKALHWCAVNNPGFCEPSSYNTITMTQDGSVAFDLLSLELARSDWDVSVQLTGFYVGGGSISTTVFVDSVTLTTLSLDSSWSNLESLSIDPLGDVYNAAVAVDNIAVVTAVPIPAAAWLFGSALAGLGWMRRKQSD